jgi:alanine racemase
MRSWIEINRNAFEHNCRIVSELLNNRAAVGIVLKANAYGHGIQEMALLAEQEPAITWLCVATVEEALSLRQRGCKKEILIIGYLDDYLLEEALKNNCVITVTDLVTARYISECALQNSVCARVHIKIDLGMHRMGCMPEDLQKLYADLRELKGVRVEGILGHVGNTNTPYDHYLVAVIEQFYKICDSIDPSLLHHVGASGLLWCPLIRSMARVGTLLYGSWKSEIHELRIMQRIEKKIIPIMSWKSCIMEIKHVRRGGYIGYDQAFCAYRAMDIAIISIGYADGYTRALSHRGVVMIRGCYAPVVGLISMNFMAVDVSHVASVAHNDEVLLIGPYERITPNALARIAHTNPNHITSGISAAIKRDIVSYECGHE